MKKGDIGFMQGRLTPVRNDKIQEFPRTNWRQEIIEAAALGFSLMEWTLDQEGLHDNPLMSAEGRQAIRGLCSDCGMRIKSLTGDCFMQNPFYKLEGRSRDTAVTDLGLIIDAAADLGITFVLIPLVDNGRISSAAEESELKKVLFGFSRQLDDRGVKIIFESDFGPERLASFISAFDPAIFGINYDTGNSASLGFDPAVEFAAYAERILNVHIKDRILGGSTVPLGTGNANFPVIFRQLRDADYRGNLILQTARAEDGRHGDVLVDYRDFVYNRMHEVGIEG